MIGSDSKIWDEPNTYSTERRRRYSLLHPCGSWTPTESKESYSSQSNLVVKAQMCFAALSGWKISKLHGERMLIPPSIVPKDISDAPSRWENKEMKQVLYRLIHWSFRFLIQEQNSSSIDYHLMQRIGLLAQKIEVSFWSWRNEIVDDSKSGLGTVVAGALGELFICRV